MNRLLNNWPLKFASLALSVGLWSHVRGESNPLETATFSVRLATKVPEQLKLASTDAPKMVRVTVQAPHLELRALGGVSLPLANPLTSSDADAPPLPNNSVVASLDFSDVSGDSDTPQTVPVRVESRSEDVEILGVKPASVSVTFQPTH